MYYRRERNPAEQRETELQCSVRPGPKPVTTDDKRLSHMTVASGICRFRSLYGLSLRSKTLLCPQLSDGSNTCSCRHSCGSTCTNSCTAATRQPQPHSRHDHGVESSESRSYLWEAASDARPCYDVVVDGAGSEAATETRSSETRGSETLGSGTRSSASREHVTSTSPGPEARPETRPETRPLDPFLEDRPRTQYAFSSETLRKETRRAASPALSDALSPTPSPQSPPPAPHRQQQQYQQQQQQEGCYPIELSGSTSSLGSITGPAPHIEIPSSSRCSTPDVDVSLCSDATLDCSPPSPVQVG